MDSQLFDLCLPQNIEMDTAAQREDFFTNHIGATGTLEPKSDERWAKNSTFYFRKNKLLFEVDNKTSTLYVNTILWVECYFTLKMTGEERQIFLTEMIDKHFHIKASNISNRDPQLLRLSQSYFNGNISDWIIAN